MEKDFLVSVMDVHQDNLQSIWPCLVFAIRNSSFIALDCELSGLGNRKLVNSQAVDERYKNIGEVARTRSIISLGLSCFKLENNCTQSSNLICQVQTFNLMALCSEDYIVEPSALQFLVNHGFDFQKQYSKGIPYYRGQDKKEIKKSQWNLRDLFNILVSSKTPLVLHNGMVDLIFLYQNLYADLPGKLATFVADLEMMFPAGIFDTKYMAEFVTRMSASFLEYVFRKNQWKNINMKTQGKCHIVVQHTLPNSNFTNFWECSPRLTVETDKEICINYTSHGFCHKGINCQQSHDVLRAIIQEDQKKNRKRKLKENANPAQVLDTVPEAVLLDATEKEKFKGHRAGHDAFMTAYSFASFIAQKLQESKREEGTDWMNLLGDIRNRLCLSGKTFPLVVQKSDFAKHSKGHLEKYDLIMNQMNQTENPSES